MTAELERDLSEYTIQQCWREEGQSICCWASFSLARLDTSMLSEDKRFVGQDNSSKGGPKRKGFNVDAPRLRPVPKYLVVPKRERRSWCNGLVQFLRILRPIFAVYEWAKAWGEGVLLEAEGARGGSTERVVLLYELNNYMQTGLSLGPGEFLSTDLRTT